MSKGKKFRAGNFLRKEVTGDHSSQGEVAGRFPRAITRTARYQAAFAQASAREEHNAQHGAVKVLWKDGKPVEGKQ